MMDDQISRSLIFDVRTGRLERVRRTIDTYGLSYSQTWSEGYILLREATELNYTEMCKMLLEKGAKVNSWNPRTKKPLHFAVQKGNLDIVELILNRGADIDAQDNSGNTPLHYSIHQKNIRIFELLLNMNANVNAINLKAETPLHIATKFRSFEMVQQLLSQGAVVECKCLNRYNNLNDYTPLHIAVEKNDKEIVDILLQNNASVNAQTADKLTPLYIAVKEDNIAIAEILLNRGASINSDFTSTFREKYTLLHIATEKGSLEMIKLLVSRGADINSVHENVPLLCIATKNKYANVVEILLEHGASVDTQDKDGKTILNVAVKNGDTKNIECILKYSPDVNNEINKNALYDALNSRDPVYNVITKNLIDYGFAVGSEDDKSYKRLRVAVKNGHEKYVEKCLQNGVDVNISDVSSEKYTLLHLASMSQQEVIADLLIKYGADVNAKDESGRTPIHCAFENNSFEDFDKFYYFYISDQKNSIGIIRLLQQHGADINLGDNLGRTPLHLSISVDLEITLFLLRNGANVNSKTASNETALHYATRKGNQNIIAVLLDYNADINCATTGQLMPHQGLDLNSKLTQEIGGGMTALHIAASSGRKNIVEMLLKRGAEINSRTKKGLTALHISSGKGYIGIVKLLLDFDADVNIADTNNSTAIHHAQRNLRSRNNVRNCNDHVVLQTLMRHILRLKTANFYVKKIFLTICIHPRTRTFYEICKREIELMKHEHIADSNITLYNILTKSMLKLQLYAKTLKDIQPLSADALDKKFPIYTSIIRNQLKKGMERNLLMETELFQNVFNLFPDLPYNCIEEILDYLNNKDLKNCIDAVNPRNNTDSPNSVNRS